jgi:hypothetical protein
MKVDTAYTTHLPVLMKVMDITNGPVLELGIGFYSTPVMHWKCYSAKRKMVSYESSEGWVKYFRHYCSDIHEINHIDDWTKLDVAGMWDVVFIDQDPAEARGLTAKMVAQNAKYVVLHDSDPKRDVYYKYSEVYPLYKYRFDFTEVRPHTTLLSNFVDLKDFTI